MQGRKYSPVSVCSSRRIIVSIASFVLSKSVVRSMYSAYPKKQIYYLLNTKKVFFNAHDTSLSTSSRNKITSSHFYFPFSFANHKIKQLSTQASKQETKKEGYLGVGFRVYNFHYPEHNKGQLLLVLFVLLSRKPMYIIDNPIIIQPLKKKN